jgi:hypothetical protein
MHKFAPAMGSMIRLECQLLCNGDLRGSLTNTELPQNVLEASRLSACSSHQCMQLKVQSTSQQFQIVMGDSADTETQSLTAPLSERQPSM